MGEGVGVQASKTDPSLFTSITKFSPQNSVYNSIHLLGTAAAGKRGIFWFQFQRCFRCLPLQIDYHFAQPQFLQFCGFCFERAVLGILYRTQVQLFYNKLPYQNLVIFKSMTSVVAFLSVQCLGKLHCDIEVSPVEITLLPFFPRCNAPPPTQRHFPASSFLLQHLESSTPAPDQQMGPLFSQGLLAFILLPYLLPHAVSVRYCFSCH